MSYSSYEPEDERWAEKEIYFLSKYQTCLNSDPVIGQLIGELEVKLAYKIADRRVKEYEVGAAPNLQCGRTGTSRPANSRAALP